MKKFRNSGMSIVDSAIARLITMILFLIGSLPLKTIEWLAGAIGNLWFAFDSRHRKVAIGNLKKAFKDSLSEQEIHGIARENFRQLSRLLFELGWALHLKSRNDIRKFIRLEGLDHVSRAYREKKGVLFLTAHMGSWELLTLVTALIPYTVHDIYRPLDYPPLERVFVWMRTRFGMKLIAKEGAIRNMLRALSKNEGIGIPLDQSVDASDGVFADFFGEPTCTSKGMGLIAIKTGAPVIPVFMVRENGRYIVIFGSRISHANTGNIQNDLITNTTSYNTRIERIVRAYPSQWFWVHNRWKTKPPAE